VYQLTSARNRLIYLAQTPLATRAFLRKVIKSDRTCTKIFHYSSKEIHQTYCLSQNKAEKLYRYLQQYQPNHDLLKRLAPFKVITIIDSDFPTILRYIPDPPVILYMLGRSDFIKQSPALAVVGTRNPSSLAKRNIYQLLKPLVDEGWILVSGMANGIDGYAHRLADYYQGKTIAVLAGGLHHPYPPEHLELFQKLSTKHLVLSEYAPHLRPERYHFPERNRLISGLSFATLVIEAKARSGSLITADQALEQGREVLAVPGNINTEQAKGTHHLIQNGAKLIQNTYDIIEEWEQSKQNWQQLVSEKQPFC